MKFDNFWRSFLDPVAHFSDTVAHFSDPVAHFFDTPVSIKCASNQHMSSVDFKFS